MTRRAGMVGASRLLLQTFAALCRRGPVCWDRMPTACSGLFPGCLVLVACLLRGRGLPVAWLPADRIRAATRPGLPIATYYR